MSKGFYIKVILLSTIETIIAFAIIIIASHNLFQYSKNYILIYIILAEIVSIYYVSVYQINKRIMKVIQER